MLDNAGNGFIIMFNVREDDAPELRFLKRIPRGTYNNHPPVVRTSALLGCVGHSGCLPGQAENPRGLTRPMCV